MNRTELEGKAKELDIEFDEETSDDDLKNAIDAVDNSNNNDDDDLDEKAKYYKSEMEKAVNKRQAEKAKVRKLNSKIKDLESKLDDTVDKKEISEFKKELKELREFKKQSEEEREKLELDKLDEADKIKALADKEVKKLQDQIDSIKEDFENKLKEKEEAIKQKESESKKLKRFALKSEVISVASKHKAISPEHVFRLVQSDFELEPNTDEYVHYVRDKNGKIVDTKDLNEYLEDFFNDENNDYLIKSGSNNEGLHSDRHLKGKLKTKNKNDDFGDYNPNDPELKEKAAREGFLDVETYIRTLLKRDSKLAKVNENRKKMNEY